MCDEGSLTKVEEEDDDREIIPNIDQEGDTSDDSLPRGLKSHHVGDTPVSKSDEDQTFSRTARTNGPAIDSMQADLMNQPQTAESQAASSRGGGKRTRDVMRS